MKWQETVMSEGKIIRLVKKRIAKYPCYEGSNFRNFVAKTQAELSFKAGYEEHKKECDACADGFISTHEKATNEVRKQGRQDVVEWIKEHQAVPYKLDVLILKEDWQAFLKEMGL